MNYTISIPFLLLASALLLWACFRMYLARTDKHVYFYYQNLRERKSDPLWSGRFWVALHPNQDKDWNYNPFSVKLEWSLFNRYASPALGFDFYGGDFDLKLHISFWLLGSLWLEFQMTPFRDWLRKHLHSTTWGYQTQVSWYSWTLVFKFAYSETWGSGPDIGRAWLPRWIHLWKEASYDQYDMHGWYLSFDFGYAIAGGYERDEEIIQVITAMDIPIEPDNSYGRYYFGNYSQKIERRWRTNFPSIKKKNNLWEITVSNPPSFAGKGENGWDQEDDGIFSCAVPGETLADAMHGYMQRVYSYRMNRGMPSWWREEKIK